MAPRDAGASDAIVERRSLLTGDEPTLAQLQASKALAKLYPDIDEVARELGAPFARGMGPRSAWWFDKRPFGKPSVMTCDGINLIKGPSGHVVLRIHAFYSESDVCATITLSKPTIVELVSRLADTTASADADLRALVRRVRGKSFDDAVELFVDSAGKPTETGNSEYAAWRYVDGVECRVLLLTTTLERFGAGSGIVEQVDDLPCE
jgi:hypothetical protein